MNPLVVMAPPFHSDVPLTGPGERSLFEDSMRQDQKTVMLSYFAYYYDGTTILQNNENHNLKVSDYSLKDILNVNYNSLTC